MLRIVDEHYIVSVDVHKTTANYGAVMLLHCRMLHIA